MKSDSSGTNVCLASLVEATMWLSRKVVCGRQFDLLSVRTNRNSSRTRGRKASIALVLVSMLLISRSVSSFVGSAVAIYLVAYLILVLSSVRSGVVYVNIVRKMRNTAVVSIS